MTINTFTGSLKDWEIFKYSLIPGCTFEYKSLYPQHKLEKALINENLTASFLRQDWDQKWNILQIGSTSRHSLYNFCWPDGSPMKGWQTYEKPRELTKEERVIKKCQSLDAKFKAKSLPRCTTKPLSFPDKKIPFSNKKEKGPSTTIDPFLTHLSNFAHTTSPPIRRHAPLPTGTIPFGTSMNINTWMTRI